jgi:hypothetical protein
MKEWWFCPVVLFNSLPCQFDRFLTNFGCTGGQNWCLLGKEVTKGAGLKQPVLACHLKQLEPIASMPERPANLLG